MALKETALSAWDKVLERTLRKEESAECAVPDTQPDIDTILSACGTPLIRSKDVSAGSVQIEANIPVKVSYLSGENTVCGLEINLPFSVLAEDAAITADCLCTAEIRLSALEAKLLNPRKISVRAELCFSLRCYCAGQAVFFTRPENGCCGVQYLERELAFSPICAVTEKTLVVTDEAVLGADAPAAEQILCQSTAAEIEEVKAAGTKVILKGSIRSSLLYRSPEGETAGTELSTDFSQVIEAGALPENATVTAVLLPSGVYYDCTAGENGRAVGLEIHLVAQIVVYGQEKVCYIADAYSNSHRIETVQTQQTYAAMRESSALRGVLTETVETPAPVGEILSVSACPGCPVISGGEISVPMCVQMFYRTAAGDLGAVKRAFRMKFTADANPGETVVVLGCTLQDITAVPTGSSAELRISAELSVLLVAEAEICAVTEILCDEDDRRDMSGFPALTVLRTDSEDLWGIAREYCSTVAAIRELNDPDTLDAAGSRMIFIPKTLE